MHKHAAFRNAIDDVPAIIPFQYDSSSCTVSLHHLLLRGLLPPLLVHADIVSVLIDITY